MKEISFLAELTLQHQVDCTMSPFVQTHNIISPIMFSPLLPLVLSFLLLVMRKHSISTRSTELVWAPEAKTLQLVWPELIFVDKYHIPRGSPTVNY